MVLRATTVCIFIDMSFVQSPMHTCKTYHLTIRYYLCTRILLLHVHTHLLSLVQNCSTTRTVYSNTMHSKYSNSMHTGHLGIRISSEQVNVRDWA